MGGRGAERDLVIVALPGVQGFIQEALSTSDVAAASEIYPLLADRVTSVLRGVGEELVSPAREAPGGGDAGGAVRGSASAHRTGSWWLCGSAAHQLLEDTKAQVPGKHVSVVQYPHGSGASASSCLSGKGLRKARSRDGRHD